VIKSQQSLDTYNRGEVQLSPVELEYLRCVYDSETHFQDRYVGQLFACLKQLRDDRRTVAVITADHGEMLGEHDLLSHGNHLFNELIHIPFILWGTDQVGESTHQVSLIDLYPTFLELAGKPLADSLSSGAISLLHTEPQRYLFAENWSEGVSRKALIDPEMKYLWQSNGQLSLFDLDSDPAEMQNLLSSRSEETELLHSLLESRFNLSRTGVDPEDIDAETMQILRSLGYVH